MGAGEMVQRVKAQGTRLDDRGSVPRSYMVGENHLLEVVFQAPHPCIHA